MPRTLFEPVLPDGKRIALLVNIMYEAWDRGTWPGVSPLGNPIPGGVPDLAAFSWAEYGHRVGILRLLDVLGRQGVRATVYASGILADLATESLVAIVAQGHELAGHGWSQGTLMPTLGSPEEARVVARCLDALAQASGVRPRGWISPRCTPSSGTPDILASQGCSWWGDVFDEDLPYPIETSGGALVAFPFGLELNDLPLVVRHGWPMTRLVEAWRTSRDVLLAAPGPRYVDLTVHAHVGGRAEGAHVLETILDEAQADPRVWVGCRSDFLGLCQ